MKNQKKREQKIKILGNGCPIAIKKHKRKTLAIVFAKNMTETEIKNSILKNCLGWRQYNPTTETFID